MPLKVIRGPVNSGKTSCLLDENREALLRQSCIFITPSDTSANLLKGRFLNSLANDAGGRAGIMGGAFTGIGAFIAKLARPALPIFSATQVALVIRQIFEDHKFKYFHARSAGLPLARQFASAIIALKTNLVGHKELEKLLATRGSLKENDLLTVLAHYEEFMRGRSLLDDGDITKLAIEALEQGQARALDDVQRLVFDEFHGFAPGQLAFLKSLKSKLSNTDIAVTFPSAVSGDCLHAKYLEKGFAKLEPLMDNLVELQPVPFSAPSVTVAIARSPLHEAQSVARRIAAELNGGVEPRQLALALRTDRIFTEELAIELERQGLAFTAPGAASFLDAPLTHTLLSLSQTNFLPASATLGGFIGACRDYMSKLSGTSEWLEDVRSSGEPEAAALRGLSVLSELDSLLRSLSVTSKLAGLGAIGRNEFIRLLLNEAGSLSPSAFGHHVPFDCVPFQSGLAVSRDTVLIPAMNSGIIPRRAGERMFFSEADTLGDRPDPVLDDIFQNAEDALAAESAVFETFTAKCKRTLFLTYSVIDPAGSETSASLFLDTFGKPEPLPPILPMPRVSQDKGWKEREAHLLTIENERAGCRFDHPQYHGLITSKEAAGLVRQRFLKSRLSPTSLEDYASCPFKFFAKKVLGMEPVEEETPEIVPKDRGTIIHLVLERFFERHGDDFKKAVSDPRREGRIRELIGNLVDEVLEEKKELTAKTDEGLKPFQRRALCTMSEQAVILDIAQAHGTAKPLLPELFEWRFGSSDSDSISIPIERDEPALIGGRVDRVDSDEEGKAFLVVDYKTGSNVKAVAGDIMKGLHLQLPLYVEAVKQFKFSGKLALGGLLFAVQQGEKKHGMVLKDYNGVYYDIGNKTHTVMTEERWNAARDAALSFAAEYVSKIRKGAFEAHPKKECSRYCDYEDVCRYQGV